MLTVAEYADKIGKPYPTVAAWLRKGKVEGASQIEFGGLKIWQIPEDADYDEPPMGRPPKVAAVNGEVLTVADAPFDVPATTAGKPSKKARKAGSKTTKKGQPK